MKAVGQKWGKSGVRWSVRRSVKQGAKMDENQKYKTALVGQFKRHLHRLGYGSSSVHMLPMCVAEFLDFFERKYYGHHQAKAEHIDIKKIKPGHITAYHRYLSIRPNKRRPGALSESYINHHIYSLKLFFSYQLSRGRIRINPMSTLEFTPPTSRPRAILTRTEIKELYAVATTLKQRAVLSLFYGCGLRRAEAEKLNEGDVHFASGLLYVRSGKGGRRRAVPMSQTVINDLKSYADNERNWTIGKKEKALIINNHGTRTRGNCYNLILKRLLEKTGIKKQISLHCLRHSIATHLLGAGMSVEYVRDFLGHKNLESTQLYTRVKSKQLWNLNST